MSLLKTALKAVLPGAHGPNCAGNYASFDAAARACANQDYTDARVTEAVLAKTRAFRALLDSQRPLEVTPPVMRVLTGVAPALRAQTLTVIDFGGALGTHYWIARAALGASYSLRWHVVEMPLVCDAGRELEDGSLRFFPTLAAAREALGGPPDLVYSDGALQCVPRPLDTLRDLMNLAAPFLHLRRVPLTTEGHELITRLKDFRLSDHAPAGPLPPGMADLSLQIPLTMLPKAEFEAAMSERYILRLRYDDPKNAYHWDTHSVDMCGYFAERRTVNP